MSGEQVIKWEACPECGKLTRHAVCAEFKTSDSDESMSWGATSFILECCGCTAVSFKKETWNSEDLIYTTLPDGDWDSEARINSTRFPPSMLRELPLWFYDLEESTFKLLLREIYIAIQNEAVVLATIGTRTLIDALMNDLVGDIGGFEQKLKAMVDNRYLSERDKELLQIMIDAGNASAHRGYEPPKDQLFVILDTLENILHRELVLQNSALKVKEKTPPRKKADT